ncbi:MAG TPA: tyrosine/phenylalanine carboxypeptidase domain-containing protein, partial [Pirellulales bacterium]
MAIVEPSDPYQRSIRELSDRLVEAQRPIRILDAIKWDASIQQAFFAGGCRENPPVDVEYYRGRPLAFDPVKLREEFSLIEREVVRKLGQFNPVGHIIRRMCREYQLV